MEGFSLTPATSYQLRTIQITFADAVSDGSVIKVIGVIVSRDATIRTLRIPSSKYRGDPFVAENSARLQNESTTKSRSTSGKSYLGTIPPRNSPKSHLILT